MNKILVSFFAILTYSLLYSCGAVHEVKAEASTTKGDSSCQQGKVKLFSDFPSGRMDLCKKLSKDTFEILLRPENTPINSSPWYAFKVVADKPTRVKILMNVEGDKHRYLPKASQNKIDWSPIDFRDRGETRSFSIDVTAEPVYIAGQEIIDNQFYIDWANELSKEKNIQYDVLGFSFENRPIYKLQSHSEHNNEWLVVLGRMHPPEITGALALFPFVERLLSDSPLAIRFRSKYNILVVPNINPDGVQAGNWRHNMNGVDLNRDWNQLQQPEVTAVHKYLQSLISTGNVMSMGIDFHSTKSDVFYTMPADYGLKRPQLVNNWVESLNGKYQGYKIIQKPGSNPDKGVFKQYFADNYNVHGVTYEMGDNTDREFISTFASDAADSLMETMLRNSE